MLTPQGMGGDHVPSLQSLSCPRQVAPPGRLAGHRPPGSVGSAWGSGLGQRVHFPEECSSGSRPAGARRPRSPGHGRTHRYLGVHQASLPRSPYPLTFTYTLPSSFSISPRRADTREDFPQPTGPTTATRAPFGTWMSKLGDRNPVKDKDQAFDSQPSAWRPKPFFLPDTALAIEALSAFQDRDLGVASGAGFAIY